MVILIVIMVPVVVLLEMVVVAVRVGMMVKIEVLIDDIGGDGRGLVYIVTTVTNILLLYM